MFIEPYAFSNIRFHQQDCLLTPTWTSRPTGTLAQMGIHHWQTWPGRLSPSSWRIPRDSSCSLKVRVNCFPHTHTQKFSDLQSRTICVWWALRCNVLWRDRGARELCLLGVGDGVYCYGKPVTLTYGRGLWVWCRKGKLFHVLLNT